MSICWYVAKPADALNHPTKPRVDGDWVERQQWSHCVSTKPTQICLSKKICIKIKMKLKLKINPNINWDHNIVKMYFLPKFGNPNFNQWCVIVWTSSKCGQFWLSSLIGPWRSWSINPLTTVLFQSILHFCFEFSITPPATNYRADTMEIDAHTHAHAAIPKAQNWRLDNKYVDDSIDLVIKETKVQLNIFCIHSKIRVIRAPLWIPTTVNDT